MTKDQVLAKIASDGPIGLEFIDPIGGFDDDFRAVGVSVYELMQDGKVKCICGGPGTLDMLEVI